MKMTTRAIVIIAAALMILAGVGMAYADDGSLQRVLKAGKLTIGAEGNWVPYVYNDIKDNNKLKGFEVEVAEEIAKRLGVKAEFNISNKWDGVIAGLDAKLYETVICGVTPIPDRQVK